MTKAIRLRISLIVIITNLIIGNGFIFISAGKDANYHLAIGMSVACIIVHFLFFRYSNFHRIATIKLILFLLLNNIAVIFLGVMISFCITDILGSILLGFLGNIKAFPFTAMFTFINFIIVKICLNRNNIRRFINNF